MPIDHIVAEGEHLLMIALQYGFAEIDAIWSHPLNSELKKLRGTPHVLLAGDKVHIPDKQPKDEAAQTGQRTVFQAKGVGSIEMHVKVTDQAFVAIKGSCVLKGGGATVSLPQKGDVFEGPLDPTLKKGELQFPTSPTERLRPSITIEPGQLDPVDTLTGQQQRLNNLGYFAGFVKTKATDPKKLDVQDPQMLWAVQEFQCDHLGPNEADGVPGKKTTDKLKEVYGT